MTCAGFARFRIIPVAALRRNVWGETSFSRPAAFDQRSTISRIGFPFKGRAIFDGKTADCLREYSRSGWRVDNGALINTSLVDSAQTLEEFADGEIRIRFEPNGLERAAFYVRQKGEGRYGVHLNTVQVNALEGKVHDLVFTCRGFHVTAALDGQAVPIVDFKESRIGCLQIGGTGKSLRILSLEHRPLE